MAMNHEEFHGNPKYSKLIMMIIFFFCESSGHIVCHKCCLELFNKDENTLECPVCNTVHTFKSKNIFKKSLQQVAHSNFGKKTTIREVSFQSTMVR